MKAYAALEATAREALLHNVERLEGYSCLSAGAHQFRSLWTRDFAHAAGGLLAAGRADVVRDHTELLLRYTASDGLLPRSLDTIDPKRRVAWASAGLLLPGFRRRLPLEGRLLAEYRDQHGQLAIDGNALVILAAARYAEATGDEAWWTRHAPGFARLLRFYRGHWRRGLVQQPPFSDWQDSVRRQGATFYVNLLVWAAARTLAARGWRGAPRVDLEAYCEALERTFRRPDGLYRSVARRPYLSLDGNLLAIDLGLVRGERAAALYEALVRTPLWTRHAAPGFNTIPDYPASWRNYGVVLAGLGHYHDRVRWSWLTALAAKVAASQGDLARAERCLDHLEELARRDGTIAEVYAERAPHLPWRSLTYRSEAPFSWGAGVTLDALARYREVCSPA